MEIISKIKTEISKITTCKNISLHCSGTDALYEIIKSLELEKDDTVLIPSFICERILLPFLKLKIKTKLVDIQHQTVTAGLHNYQSVYDPTVKVLLLVHPWGYVSNDIFRIIKWAKEKNIVVIEDIASALGLSYQGVKLGRLGKYCFGSFGHDKLCAVGEIGFSNLKNIDSLELKHKTKGNQLITYNTLIKFFRKRYFELIRPFVLDFLSHIPRFSFKRAVSVDSMNHLLDKLSFYYHEVNERKSLVDFYLTSIKGIFDFTILPPNNDQDVVLRVACVFNSSFVRDEIILSAMEKNLWLGKDYPVPLHDWLFYPKGNFEQTILLQKRIINLITNPTNQDGKEVMEMIKYALPQNSK